MKILVAVKRVIDYNVQIRVKEDGSGVVTDNVKMSTNPPDDNAIEEAVKIKEAGKATEIVAITVGEEKAQETVRKALAVGADKGIHVKTEGALEPLAVSKIIQKIVEKEKPDLVFMGKQAIDALSYGQTRPGSIKGTVKDKRTGEVIPFATVIVKDKDVVIATGTTDFDGKYNINPVNAGVYNLTCNFIGYADFNLNGVTVYSGKPKVVNFNMTVESTMIQEVTVTAPEELIETGKTSEIVTSEEIKNLPYRNLSQIVGTTAGVFQQDGSGSFNVRGSRSSTNVVFIDGVKVRGDVNLPRDAILQTEVIVGGTPAQYGDDVPQS